MGEALNKTVVIISKSNKDFYLLYTFRRGLFPNNLNLFRLYYYAILGYYKS